IVGPPAAVRQADADVVLAAKRAITKAGEACWQAADAFAELRRRGWGQQRIAEAGGKSQPTGARYRACAALYSPGISRPAFGDVYEQVRGKDDDPGVEEWRRLWREAGVWFPAATVPEFKSWLREEYPATEVKDDDHAYRLLLQVLARPAASYHVQTGKSLPPPPR